MTSRWGDVEMGCRWKVEPSLRSSNGFSQVSEPVSTITKIRISLLNEGRLALPVVETTLQHAKSEGLHHHDGRRIIHRHRTP